MKLKLMDYKDRTKEFEIGGIYNILRIDIKVLQYPFLVSLLLMAIQLVRVWSSQILFTFDE